MNALHIRPIAETADSVTLRRADFDALQELLDDMEDVKDIAALSQKLDTGESGTLPADIVNRLLEGQNPVRVVRDYRGLSVSALADASGTSQSFLSEIETGRKRGSIGTLARIATALSVPVDLLIRPDDL